MIFRAYPVDEAEGATLAHSVRHRGGSFKKGRVLSRSDIEALKAAGIEQVHAARFEADDVPEDEAAGALAQALAGEGASCAEPFTGRANLYAGRGGILTFDPDLINRINQIDESLTVATLSPFDRVVFRQMLATVKVIPFAVPRAVVDEALRLAGASAGLSVTALKPHRVGLIVTRLPQTKDSIIAKSEVAIRDRVEALGSTLAALRVTGHDAGSVEEAIRDLRRQGCAPVLVFGASAIVDRGDVIPTAVEAAGGEIVHLGMPVDPGNLLMLGRVGETPVIGVPSCARSPKVNGFDWVLERTLAGMDLGPREIMAMGVGGLLMEIPSRPVPREGLRKTAPQAPAIAAVILAAGRSMRMQGENKLLKRVGGKSLIRRTVETALASQARPVIVVVGHEGDRVGAALEGLDVTIVANPDYADGLSTSLKAGVAAIPEGADGAVICLGDMPMIEARHIDRLISAFNPGEGRGICVPVHRGKQGNPVLWSAHYFAAMSQLAGDIGARHLIAENRDEVCEVPMASAAVLTDLDTPEAFDALAG